MTALSEPSPAALRLAVNGSHRIREAHDDSRCHLGISGVTTCADVVRQILADEPFDAGDAETVLGYHLDRQHIAMTLWYDTSPNGADTAYLRGVVCDVQRHLGVLEPLMIQGGPGRLWAWGNQDRVPIPLRIADMTPPRRDVRVALGTPADGLGGFRRSHQQAMAAERVARRSNSAEVGWVTSYAEVAIPAMLTTDADAARRFVQRELGLLAAETTDAADLRAAVLSYLEEESNHFAASRRLQVSPSTLLRHVNRAGELLNYDVATRRHALHTALILADRFAAQVLDPA